MVKRHLAVCLFALMPAGLGGCGLTTTQRAALTRFTAAAGDFATVAEKEFVQTRKDVIEMNAMSVQLGKPVGVDLAEFDLAAAAPMVDLDGKLDPARVRARLDAVAALRSYAELLSTLATSTQRGDMQAAADSFVGALRQVDGIDIRDADAQAVSAAIQAVGGLLIEPRRKRAVVAVVDAAHVPVTGLAALVARSMDPDDEYWSLEYARAMSLLKATAVVNRQLAAGDVTKMPHFEAAQVLLQRKHAWYHTVPKRIIAAAEQLARAQYDLRVAMHTDRFDAKDVDAFVARVEELVGIYKTFADR